MIKKRGVPKGFRHNWTYRGHWDETKVKPGLWKFRFKATKRQHARGMGNFGIGTTGAWEIKAKQYIKKTGKGKYQTEMIGTKKPLKFHVKKRRYWKMYKKARIQIKKSKTDKHYNIYVDGVLQDTAHTYREAVIKAKGSKRGQIW